MDKGHFDDLCFDFWSAFQFDAAVITWARCETIVHIRSYGTRLETRHRRFTSIGGERLFTGGEQKRLRFIASIIAFW